MKPIILQPGPRAWLSSSILSAYQDRYVACLQEDRYTQKIIRVYLASVAHFARWLGEQRIDLSSLNKAMLDRFLNDHLPICSCPQPVRRTRHEVRRVELLESATPQLSKQVCAGCCVTSVDAWRRCVTV